MGEGSNVKGDNRGKSWGKGEGLRVGKRGRVKVG